MKRIDLGDYLRRVAAGDGYFSVGEEVLYGKFKNRRGRIVRIFDDDRGVPSVEIEPIPKGRKKNKVIGLYKIWKAGSVRVLAYSDEFLEHVRGKRFRNPQTGNKVLFRSLPPAEQRKVHDQWKAQQEGDGDRVARAREIAEMGYEAAAQLDTDELDRVAFGVTQGVQEMPLSDLKVKYDADLEQAEHAVSREPDRWKEHLDEPIEVKLRDGEFHIEDGHHRYVTAKRMGLDEIKVDLTIDDNPVKKIFQMAGKRVAAMSREACIIAGRRFDGRLCLFKNRDRAYDAELEVLHLERDGVEMAVVLDTVTGYIEGVNEHGIGVVNTTLMVVRDEAEGKKKVPKEDKGDKGKRKPLTSKDGPKIFRAMGLKDLDDVVESLRTDDGGIRGHTFVADGDRLVSIECSKNHPARVHELDPSRVNTRTNHGISYPDAGYTHGDDYVSSIVRRWEAQKRLQDVKRPEAVGPTLWEAIHDADSPFNPVRSTDKMRTTSQLTIDTTRPGLYLYLVPGHAKLLRRRNLLPDGREPKIPVRVFRYRDRMEDREEIGRSASRVVARYKSKKKVKTKDGDERTVYEYSDRQVSHRNRAKAERVEKLRRKMKRLREKVRKDVRSDDDGTRGAALAVALMDATYERPGNRESVSDGRYGVTTWKIKHVSFDGREARVKYRGKSGVDQTKTIEDKWLVEALREACEGRGRDACVVGVTAAEVNRYLEPMGITSKDIRGMHANRLMKEHLRAVRSDGPKLPDDRRERKDLLKGEFKRALETAAEEVGHEPSTLRSQYLVPGLEDDYMKDGTVSDSHVKKGAEAVTDTGTFYVIAPEALKDMLDDTPWHELSHQMWPDSVAETAAVQAPDPGAAWDEMGRHVRESGGAVIETGGDGGFDVGVRGAYDDRGDLEVIPPGTVVEKGAVPPYGLRTAAERGTPTERRILANALLAPVLVARPRTWWIRNAPNLYRIARRDERPRPSVEGIRFPPEMFAVLWHEDEDGNRLPEPDDEGTEAAYDLVPEGAAYQFSQFPCQLTESVLRLEDDGTSTEIMRGNKGFPSDLVTAMVRSGQWDVGDAIMVAAQACERCLNVMLDHHGLDGYPFGSDEYWRAGTSCSMCEHVPEPAGRTATKTPAEREEEKVQKMLRKEPKKKPPRYDLRDNRTLDEDDEDEDLRGMGGGDDGDRDLSLKWNRVASRVALRWVARGRIAKDDPGAEFKKFVEGKKFQHPETRNEVVFQSLPTEEQKRIYQEWKGQQKPEDEGRQEKKKEEEGKGAERTREDVEVDLDNARDEVEDLESDIASLRDDMKAAKQAIKELKKFYEKASPANKEQIEGKIKEQKRELRRMDDELDDKQDELKGAQKRVDDLKAERKDPGGTRKRLREELRKKRQEKVRRQVSRAQDTVKELLGEDSELPKDLRSQLEKQLNALDDAQVEDFAASFASRMKELRDRDPLSEEAVEAANSAAEFGDLYGLDDPDEIADRLAQLSYATNVVANPMNVGGIPVGRTEMTDEKYGERAHQAFEQYQHLHPKLRRSAVDRLGAELRNLDPDTHRARELNAILTGMDVAQIADTGESLPGRPQPSRGNAALIRKMVEHGQVERMFKPAEDFFADDAREAMSDALQDLDAEEVADLATGGKKDAGYSDLHDLIHDPKTPDVMKEMMKDFLAQDILNDAWGDRAVRDTMQAAGVEDADDPEVRAQILEEAKLREKPNREKVLEARARAEEARRAGREPDPEDARLVQQYFDPEGGQGLQRNVKSLFDVLRDKFKKVVVSPATAVLKHFVEKDDPEVLSQETRPHPDERAKDPRPKEEREEARADRETPEDEEHGPGDVWETEQGNWRAKNPDGVPKSFKSREDAERHAKAEEEFSAEFDVPVEERGPTRFASVGESWLARVRAVHPDDPDRPVVVVSTL